MSSCNKHALIVPIGWHCATRGAHAYQHCELYHRSCFNIYTNFLSREVHMSDLIKSHEGNDDVNESDPLKIHWRKYSMMGGFVGTTLQCKAQCLNSTDYHFPERPAIVDLIMKYPVMSIEVWLHFICF